MKITLDNLDAEDLEVQTFVKFKSKKHKLKGKQSVTQLVSRVGNYADPDSKCENSFFLVIDCRVSKQISSCENCNDP